MPTYHVIHLLPKYRQSLKRAEHVHSVGMLRGCFEATELDLFLGDQDYQRDYELLNDTITSYINFCVDSVIGTIEIKIYPNNKPWVSKELKHHLNLKKIAFIQDDLQKTKDLTKEVRRQPN